MPSCLPRSLSCRISDNSPPHRVRSKPSYIPSPLAQELVVKDERVEEIRLGGIKGRVMRRLETVRLKNRPGFMNKRAQDPPPITSLMADDASWITVEQSPKPNTIPVHIRRQQLRALDALGADQQEAIGKHMRRIDTSIADAKQNWKQAVDAAKGTLDSADSVASDNGSSPVCKRISTNQTSSNTSSPSFKPNNSTVLLRVRNGKMDPLPLTKNGLRPSYSIAGSATDLSKTQSQQCLTRHRRGILSTDSAMLIPEEGDDVHTFDHIITFDQRHETVSDIAAAVREKDRKDRRKGFSGNGKGQNVVSSDGKACRKGFSGDGEGHNVVLSDGKSSHEEHTQGTTLRTETTPRFVTEPPTRNSRRIEWWLQSVPTGEPF